MIRKSHQRLIVLWSWLLLAAGTVAADAIHDAALNGDLNAIKTLLERDPSLLTSKGRNGKVPLHWAAQGGQLAVVELLLRMEAPVDSLNDNNETPLHYAAYFDHLAVAAALISHSADPNARSRQGQTPLIQAVEGNHLKMVKFLLDNHAHANDADGSGFSPLHYAALGNQREIFYLLVGRGADLFAKNTAGVRPIEYAARKKWDILEKLIAVGRIDPAAESGRIMLHAVTAAGNARLAELLINRGADTDLFSDRGDPLLISAAKGSLLALAKRILDDGGSVDVVNKEDRTALHYAVLNGDLALVKMLLENGADINRRGADGRTPRQLAEDLGLTEMESLLISERARDLPREILLLGKKNAPLEKKLAHVRKPFVAIAYIGNDGFLISTFKKKILIDALHGLSQPVMEYGYDPTPVAAFSRMLNSQKPFERIDLLLFSHAHADHFDAAMSQRFLTLQPQARLLGNQAVVAELKKTDAENFTSITPRLNSLNPPWSVKMEYSVADVDLKVFVVIHAFSSQKYAALAFLINLDGITLLHLGDMVPEANVGYLESLNLDAEEIDIAFLGRDFLRSDRGRDLLKRYLRPKAVVLTHVQAMNAEDNHAELSRTFPNIVVFHEPLETKYFCK